MLGKRRFDRNFVKICTLTAFSRTDARAPWIERADGALYVEPFRRDPFFICLASTRLFLNRQWNLLPENWNPPRQEGLDDFGSCLYPSLFSFDQTEFGYCVQVTL